MSKFVFGDIKKYQRVTTYSTPKQIAHFSYDENRKFTLDDTSLKRYMAPHIPSDLNEMFSSKISKPEVPMPLNSVIHATTAAAVDYNDYDLVTWRGVLTKIMTAIYLPDAFTLEMRVVKGVLFVQEEIKARPVLSAGHRLACYWGVRFERLACVEKEFEKEDTKQLQNKLRRLPVNTNVEYGVVLTSVLKDIKILFSAEIDCCDEKGNFIELKTTRLDPKDTKGFQLKIYRYWAQSFLANVPHIIVGARDKDGILRGLDRLSLSDLPKVGRHSNLWDGNVGLSFMADVITWLKSQVILEEVGYRLDFNPRYKEFVLEEVPMSEGLLNIFKAID